MKYPIDLLLDELAKQQGLRKMASAVGSSAHNLSLIYERTTERIKELEKAIEILTEHQKGTP